MTDRFSESGAGVLARKIERYWRNQGHPSVRAWIEPIGKEGEFEKPIFAVRSNLLNGLPPAEAIKRAA